MSRRSDEFVQHVNELWKQAVDQLEEVRQVVTGRIEGRLGADIARLRQERDKLLLTLGEQTYKLTNQGRLPVPDFVKRTVDRLNEVIDTIVKSEKQGQARAKAGKKKASKKKATRKTTKKKTTKKA